MAMNSYGLLGSILTILAAMVLFLHEVDAKLVNPWTKQSLWSVSIYNEVPILLEVHCRSSQDDLMVHYLHPQAPPFSFYFHSNFWGSTTFHCMFRYTFGNRWNAFDVWTDHGFFAQNKRPCEHCMWYVRTDAFYRGENGSAPVSVHPWRTDKAPP